MHVNSATNGLVTATLVNAMNRDTLGKSPIHVSNVAKVSVTTMLVRGMKRDTL